MPPRARPVTGRRTGTRGPAGNAYRLPGDGSATGIVRVPPEPHNSLDLTETGDGVPGDRQE